MTASGLPIYLVEGKPLVRSQEMLADDIMNARSLVVGAASILRHRSKSAGVTATLTTDESARILVALETANRQLAMANSVLEAYNTTISARASRKDS